MRLFFLFWENLTYRLLAIRRSLRLFISIFSKNRLSYLPDDFFENMPSLKIVSLQQNKFTTLSEKPFSELFRYRPYSLYMTGKGYYEYIDNPKISFPWHLWKKMCMKIKQV